MKRRVAVSCAPPGVGRGANLGMNTVDYAIHNIARERGVADRVRLRRPWPPYNGSSEGRPDLDRWPMDFDYGLDGLSREASTVLYWGDFQHGRDYLHQSARRMRRVLSNPPTLEECVDRCFDRFMLENEVAGVRVAMFGGTLFQNRLEDYGDRRYRSALEALYTSADFIRVRDPYSATKVGEIRGDFRSSYLGVDAALLNTREELLALERTESDAFNAYDGAVGVFFGRYTESFPRRAALRFLQSLARGLEAPTAWLPWERFAGGLLSSLTDEPGAWNREMLRLPEGLEITPGDILSLFGRLRLVVTDTYHVAVNAIVFGVPCVCVYEPAPAEARNANMGFHTAWRDKRALLFLTFDLSDFLVSTADLRNRIWRKARAENVLSLLGNGGAAEQAYAGVRALAAHDRRAVGDFLVAETR